MVSPLVSRIAVPAVLSLVCFLGYSSQYLFAHLDPRPLDPDELVSFNLLLLCLFICYYRACTTDPGRLRSSAPDRPSAASAPSTSEHADRPWDGDAEESPARPARWCRRCSGPKWPRSHHCKTCGRCIPKMDHHCPWTVNCVSHTTYPHFIRFVFYAVASMAYLWRLLWARDAVLWRNRNMSSYFGPSVVQLVHLFLLNVANFLTFFALAVLLARSLWNLAVNQTTIETWEIERHEALLRRARHFGGYLDGPDGTRIRIVRQEFPYDIGVFKNIAQGMGSANPLMWLLPFAPTPSAESGASFETNGFEDASVTWPPPDPDRIARSRAAAPPDSSAFTFAHDRTDDGRVDAFRRRQEQDMQRWRHDGGGGGVRKRRAFHQRFDADARPLDPDAASGDDESGEEGWRNGEGERLDDFGVDEDVEFYDEDVPLAQLIRRRKAAQ